MNGHTKSKNSLLIRSSLSTKKRVEYWHLPDTRLKSKEGITGKNQATNNGFNW